MPDRLCGKEQEYGMRILPTKKFIASLPQGILLPPEHLEYYLKEDSFTDWRRGFAQAIISNIMNSKIPNFSNGSDRIWLANGSLIYIDLKCIVETATAECRAGSLDGLLQEKASELILNEAAQSVVAQRGIESLTLYKNNVGPSGLGEDRFNEVTYGSHHNYSYLESKQVAVFQVLKSFLPVSIIFSGNGHVYKHRNNIMYALSQRASHITLAQSGATLDNRAIVTTRDESLMDRSTGLSRLHLISRDATRCEFQTWLVDTITHLVLRLAEEGWKLPLNLSLSGPVTEMHAINLSLEVNLDYKAACWPFGVNRIDIFEYNKIFLDAAKQLSPLSEPEKLCLQEWERVLELLKARAFDQLVGELDWVTKWWLLKKKMSKYFR
ncbi:MAG: proteasome accessory factor PafA2 family protein [Candidatus Harrisonbacteria bacterium]|nr:proteasome accessory factor PafA2 family protein [Candidatus Harrisonbacteria bacterium]